MASTYLIHSNRQNRSAIDFSRLFDELGVVATYGAEEYGEQLQPLSTGDRILLYDQPSGQYIAAGTVSAPWDGSAITDSNRMVVTSDESAEYHVAIDWDRWYEPGEGYDRGTVNRALGYPTSYAPPRTVSSANGPDTNDLDRVYTALVQNEILGPSLTPEQREILEQWREVIRATPSGAEFDLEGHNRTEVIPELADEFIADPTRDKFVEMWNQMHSAIQGGQGTQIFEKWSGSVEDLADLIEEIRDADQYDAQWEETLGGKTTVRELFGSLHIVDHPILNAASANGLTYFGYENPRSYAEGEQYFTEFLATYEQFVGHATNDADHGTTVPIRFEVDQLFNIIDKVDEQSLKNESSDAAIELYEKILEGNQPPPASSFFWVNQTNQDEIENGYLEASVDDVWHHDLTKLDTGDTVIHYHDSEIIGYSTVTEEASILERSGESRYRVEVDFERFDEPRPIDEVRDYLMREDVRGEKYYPLDTNGEVTQTYLSRLTDAAAEHLLEGMAGPDYYWVTANPDIWSVDSISDGGKIFYTATNSNGNSRRIISAFESAAPGDRVLFYESNPMKAIVAEGTIAEGLHEESREEYGGSVDGITIHYERRIDPITWAQLTDLPDLEEAAPIRNRAQGSLFELSSKEFETILALEELADTKIGAQTTFGDHSDDLAALSAGVTVDAGPLYFPEHEWERIESRVQRALESGNHVLFFGPPGTGKTKLARQVCEATVGKDDYELVTASADWSTFDTVGGYQTTAANTLEFQPGVVLDRFQADADGRPANEWLIIDELNRADIDKAFGSLFSALTGESVTLPFDSSDGDSIEILDSSRTATTVRPSRFYIPDDWRMLATMNTLDKTSLYEMSYAFMRRWAFVPIGIPDLPAPEAETVDGESALAQFVGEYVDVWAENGTVPQAEHHYERVGRLWYAVNRQRAIGPAIIEDIYSYVASTPTVEDADYVSPLIMYVFPQLEGLRRSELEDALEELDTIVADEHNELWTTARDFFQVDLEAGST